MAYRTSSTTISTNDSVYMNDGTTVSYNNTESVYIDEYVPEYDPETGEPLNLDPIDVLINKSDSDQHLVFGWANVSLNADESIPLDWQGDVTAPQVLEKAAYKYVLKNKGTGEMHQGEQVGYLVESVMMTKQKQEAMGIPEGTIPEGWWIGFYIPDDEVVAKIKTGEYKMFSIQGKAKKISV